MSQSDYTEFEVADILGTDIVEVHKLHHFRRRNRIPVGVRQNGRPMYPVESFWRWYMGYEIEDLVRRGIYHRGPFRT